MDIGTALRALGVSPQQLSAAEKAQLDRDGFLPLPGILSAGPAQPRCPVRSGRFLTRQSVRWRPVGGAHQDSTPWARMRLPVDESWRIASAFT